MLIARVRGVTLIELMLGMTIISCLLLVGMPSFSTWIQDVQLRGAAESIQSGLLLARSEAIRRNRPVQVTLGDSGGLVGWRIACVTAVAGCPDPIAQKKPGDVGLNIRIAARTAGGKPAAGVALAAGAGLPVSIVFNGLGQLSGSAPARIEVSHVRLDSAQRLQVTIDGSLARICKWQQDCA